MSPTSATSIDPKLLARVRALLAKAESTSFPEEAAAYTAKAQELMARNSIDAALLERLGPADASSVGGHELVVDDPYASAKAVLLGRIAAANHGSSVWNQARRVATVFAFEVDAANIELLYTSLLVQATASMTAAGPQVDAAGRVRTRSFRSSFLLSFAYRIGERLAEATQAVTDEVAATQGADLLPVLASRDEAVREARDEAFPHLVRRSTTVRHPGGWFAGRLAADVARLPGAALPPG